MEVSRILRVLITLIFLVTFITLTVAAYRQNQKINSMTTLTEATSSIANKLVSQDLTWINEQEASQPPILDSEKLKDLEYNRLIAGENFAFQASIVYQKNNTEKEIGPYGRDTPENRMICSISLPVALHRSSILPAKLGVKVWYS